MKTVLITGGSRGIGAAAVEHFRKKGDNVAFFYKNSLSRANSLSEKTGALGIRCDVRDRNAVRLSVKKVIAGFGNIDVLINNAGISSIGMFRDVTEEAWAEMIDTDLGGVYRVTQEVLPSMVYRHSGRIINVSSMWGICGASCEAAYSAAKAGVIGLTKALAKELGPSNICVNCIAPGVIDTEMNKNLDDQTIEELKNETPLGRIGTAADIVELMDFLASDKSGFITGQVISSNGGFVV